jgi:transcription factor SPT20
MLEELYMEGIPFYDSTNPLLSAMLQLTLVTDCMIVEVHDHRSGASGAKKESGDASQSTETPFSIHNYNSFITPSPYVPYPEKPVAKNNQSSKPSDAGGEKSSEKDNMAAPPQGASQKQPAKPKVTTVVLFPTQQAHLVDMQLLATTPSVDIQTYRRNQAAGRSAGHPPTPLTAVPPTPTFPTGRSPKRPKMVIDDTNAYEFESALLLEQSPKLYLEPTKDLYESLAIMEAITHPNNKNPPPARKSRKRTVAELAADEAEAANVQRFMLAGDEFQATKAAAMAGGEDGQTSVRDPNFQTFSRFKALQQIRAQHEEAQRRKKEEDALQAQAKRQAQEQEAKKRKEMEAASRQAEQTTAMRQELLRQQQAQQAMQQDQALRAVSQAQQMAGSNATQPTPQSATQPQFSSPVVRQQTPMAGAASPMVSAHSSHPMGGTPMVATSSNHGGAGSPPRPPSSVSHHAAAMARSLSQQQIQPMSRTGTPQMVQGTPVMGAAGPPRNMTATPQPRVSHGSPSVGMRGGTPMMMQTPHTQPGHGSMTPEQMQHLQANQQMQRMRLMQQQQGMQAAGQTMSPQQSAMMKASAYIQQHGIPQGQNPQQYKQMLATKFYQNIMQQNAQANMNAQASGAMPGQTAGVAMGQPGMGGNMSNLSLQQQIQLLKNRYEASKRNALQTYAGQAIPPTVQQNLHNMQLRIRQQETQLMAMSGGQPGHLQQYQNQLQQQRAQQARQQQLLAMQQRQGMNSNQMAQNMMGNMGNMGTMGTMGNMGNMANMASMGNMGNMANMGNMGMMNGMNMGGQNTGSMPNAAGMNGHGMGVMNSGQMGQMNPQQQQQMQMMFMRQQQQQAQMMNHQQRPQGDGTGMEWNG